MIFENFFLFTTRFVKNSKFSLRVKFLCKFKVYKAPTILHNVHEDQARGERKMKNEHLTDISSRKSRIEYQMQRRKSL